METRGRSQDENGDRSGERNESSFGDETVDEDGNGNAGGIREGGGEVKKRKKRHKKCRRDQALLFRTRHHLGRQGVALAGTRRLCSQGLVPIHAHHTDGVTGSERQEGSNGVGSGIGVGGRNGDGNGVGSGTGTERERGRGRGRGWSGNGNGKEGGGERGSARWKGAETGTGTGTGLEIPGRTQDGYGDGSGDGNESNGGDGNGDENGNGNEDKIRENGGLRRSARNRTGHVDAMWETGETWVERGKT